MLYFAYGSNLWRQQMMARCPEQREIGRGRLDGWRWIITVVTIVAEIEGSCPV